jgi:hypothetical protein
MKIKKNENGNFTVEMTAGEMDKFLNNCYKSYQENSIQYFHGLYDDVAEKVDELNGIQKKNDE